jgi:uncharacterized membrane protein
MVTRFIKIFSIIIMATILILVIVGILAPRNTYFTRTQIIKGPISVVWRNLTDVENYPTWQLAVRNVVLKDGRKLREGSILQFYMADYDPGIYHETEITKFEEGKLFTYIRTGTHVNPLLKEYQVSYSLKRLLDGTTEISVTISYHTYGFFTKIYNQLFLHSKLGSQAERNLGRLKSSIEKL